MENKEATFIQGDQLCNNLPFHSPPPKKKILFNVKNVKLSLAWLGCISNSLTLFPHF